MFLAFLECNAQAPYCGLSGSTIFFYIHLKNGTSFGTEVTEHKMCGFIFTTTFVWNILDEVTEILS